MLSHCAASGDVDWSNDQYGNTSRPAICQINVNGALKDIEANYIPKVLACEHNAASDEALKALAISVRSVAYYAMDREGGIGDGQQWQVYSCKNSITGESIEPNDRHYHATQQTSGLVLRYGDAQVYGFYVSGDPQVRIPEINAADDVDCDFRNPNVRDDLYNTARSVQHWITNNYNREGAAVTPTALGFNSGQNRGALGQFAASCLADLGWGYCDILRYFYGKDIGILPVTSPELCGISAVAACSSHMPVVPPAQTTQDIASTYTACPADERPVTQLGAVHPSGEQYQGRVLASINDMAVVGGRDGAYGTLHAVTDIHAYQISIEDKPVAALDPEVALVPRLVYHEGVPYYQPFLMCAQYVGGANAPTCILGEGSQAGSEVHLGGANVCCAEGLSPRIRLQGLGKKASNDDGVLYITVSGRQAETPFECHSYSLNIGA